MQNLSPEEQAVYDLIASNIRITQLSISKHEKWLGCHEKHEGHLNIDKQQTTLRRIRKIIRDMRINKGMAILSDANGYYLLKNPDEAKEFIERLEKTAKAQAKSWMVTYHSIKKTLGVKSEYFEKENSKIVVKEHTRRKSVTQPNQINQNRLF